MLDLVPHATGPTVITPHFRELAGLLSRRGKSVTAAEISSAPGEWAARAAGEIGVTVLLKGTRTFIASPGGALLRVTGAPAWLATAGSGDVLAGILGALLATHSAAIDTDAEALADLAATAALVHALAATRASGGGPITALDVAETIPATIATLLAPASGGRRAATT